MKKLRSFVILSAIGVFSAACGSSSPNSNAVRPTNVAVTAQTNHVTSNAVTAPKAASNTDSKGDAAVDRRAALRAEEVDETLKPVDPSEDLFRENCIICHKATGKGGKLTLEGKTINPIDLTSAKTKARSDEKLLEGIKNGSPEDGMPAFGEKLSDENIMSIINHIRTLK